MGIENDPKANSFLPKIKTVVISRFEKGLNKVQDDFVSVEEPLEIQIGHGNSNARKRFPLAVTMRTPGDDFNLVRGFLFAEGLILRTSQELGIKYLPINNEELNSENTVLIDLCSSIKIDESNLKRFSITNSSCGLCGKSAIDKIDQQAQFNLRNKKKSIVNSKVILKIGSSLKEKQKQFSKTGSIHAAALFSIAGELRVLKEDIGRHNALDKLVGAQLKLNNLPLHRSILLLSGRASFELIQKAWMAGIEIVAAVGAPSSLAIELAQESGITLIGFLKENRFNIYTHPERITIEQ